MSVSSVRTGYKKGPISFIETVLTLSFFSYVNNAHQIKSINNLIICVGSACFIFSNCKCISNNHNFFCSAIFYTHSLDLTLSNYFLCRWVLITSQHAVSTEIWKIDYLCFYWSRKSLTIYISILSLVWPWTVFHLLWNLHWITSCNMYFYSDYIGWLKCNSGVLTILWVTLNLVTFVVILVAQATWMMTKKLYWKSFT